MRFNTESAGERFRKIARAMGAVGIDAMSIDAARVEAVRRVYSLAEGLSVPTSLRAIGASKEDIPALVAAALLDFCARRQPPRGEVGGRCRAVHGRVLDRADGPVAGPGAGPSAHVASTSTRAGRAAGGEGPDLPNEPNSRGSRYADESRTTSSGWNRTCW
jgi:hypothetical protein